MISILIIAVLSAIAQFFMPWWIIAPIAFGVCFWRSNTAGKASLEGIVGVALVWAVYVIFLNFQNQSVLAARMGELLIKTPNTPSLLLIITPLIGGFVGGVAGLAGFYVRQALFPKPATQRVSVAQNP